MFHPGGDLLTILHQQNQQAAEDDQDDLDDDSLLEQGLEQQPEPSRQALPDEAARSDEPVAQAEAHLVGKADGVPTQGQDAELRDALAAETESKVTTFHSPCKLVNAAH